MKTTALLQARTLVVILLLLETASSSRAGGASGVRATASTGDADYAPAMALDGNFSTRWSSGFGDDEWWQAEFDQPRTLAGIRLNWETAYGEKYLVQVSDNGQDWRTVYDVQQGDGRVDILYFGPVTAKFLKLKGVQRGTGWGYSLWEAGFIDAAHGPKITAEGEHPEAIVDGDRATAWHSAADGEQAVTISLPDAQELGGAELQWGGDYAVKYAIETTADGKTWKTLREVSDGNGGMDYVFFPATKATALRIACRASSAGKGYALAQVELKGGEEQATPLLQVQARARDARKGSYLMWLGRQQEFWTVIGLPEDEVESLLGETGAFEPYKNGFSVLPFVREGDRCTTWADVTLDQALADKYLPLPSATWTADAWKLEVTALPCGEAGASGTAVRYRVTPRSDKPFHGTLALAVLPVQLNPVWQNGGFSAIREVRCVPDTNSLTVKINGRAQLVSVTKPTRSGATRMVDGDAVQHIFKGDCGAEPVIGDDDGLASAVLMYDLAIEPGGHADVVLYYPLHDGSPQVPAADFDSLLAQQKKFWHGLLDRFSIEIPEPRLIPMMKSYLAYILINKDGPWTKPGSRNYAHSWIRDGECTSVAMMRLGLTDQARDYINAYTPFIHANGWVPHLVFEGGKNSTVEAPTGAEGNEYDGLGEYVALVRQYVDFTGDDALLKDKYPTIVNCLKFGQGLRRERMTDAYRNDPAKKAYFGILPESNSHEGYYPAKHSYWDDYWFLRGLRDGIHLAKRLGMAEDAAWMQAELDDFSTCLRESILAVIARDHLDSIPGCVEKGDFDATSTAIAISDCEARDALPEPYGWNTFDRYYKEFAHRLQPGGAVTFTPYEVRTADAFIKLGERDRALTMLRYFSGQSSHPPAWNHLAEVVNAVVRAPSYIGDMPHTWVGAGYINAVRSIFAYETGDKLVVAAGIPVEWLNAGVTVKELPTQFGKISYVLRREGTAVTLSMEGEAAPPQGFAVRLPADLKGSAVEINDKAASVYGDEVTFERLPVVIRLQLQKP